MRNGGLREQHWRSHVAVRDDKLLDAPKRVVNFDCSCKWLRSVSGVWLASPMDITLLMLATA
jgi:hypothetical protein